MAARKTAVRDTSDMQPDAFNSLLAQRFPSFAWCASQLRWLEEAARRTIKAHSLLQKSLRPIYLFSTCGDGIAKDGR